MLTGVLVARAAFIDENPAAVSAFLEKYAASVAYVNGHIEDAAKLIGEYGIIAEDVARDALPACNITYVDGAEMKAKLSGYLQVLFDQNPKAVGGAMPGDDFYYGA